MPYCTKCKKKIAWTGKCNICIGADDREKWLTELGEQVDRFKITKGYAYDLVRSNADDTTVYRSNR
jgi:hypothetical protein